MSFVRWSQELRISFMYHMNTLKNDVTTSDERIYELRFCAPAAVRPSYF